MDMKISVFFSHIKKKKRVKNQVNCHIFLKSLNHGKKILNKDKKMAKA